MDLNIEQAAAANVESKHALILAGPGTGKTTVTGELIAKLVDKNPMLIAPNIYQTS